MANRRSSGWVPILTSSSGVSAAWEGIEAVAEALVQGDYQRGRARGEDDALLYAYLAAARSDESWAVRATEQLNATIDQAASDPGRLGLYGGLCGLGWTVEHVSQLLDAAFPTPTDAGPESPGDDGGEEVDLNADIDAAVLEQLRQLQPETWFDRYP